MRKSTLFAFVLTLSFLSFNKVNAQEVIDLTAIESPTVLVDTLPDLNSGAIVLLKPGMVYEAGGHIFDKSVSLQSSNPSNLNLPKIECSTNFDLADGATIDSLIFRNIEFYGTYDARYVMNTTVAATLGKLMFDGCHIHDLRGVLRMKDAGPGTLNHFIVHNSVVEHIRDYGLLTVDINTWMCNNIVLQNSTFSKIRAFITSRNNSTSLVIDGCTFSEVTAAGQRMFRWREAGQDNITDGILVKNTLWGPGWDETAAGSTAFDGYDGLGATTWTFENTYATSDLVFAEGKDTIKGFNFTYESLSTDLWVNPADGNLLFKDEVFAGIGNAGDQRWGIATDDGGVVWNMTDTVFSALGTIDTTMTVAGLTVHASGAKSVAVDANNKTVDEMSFRYRMKLGGSGDFDADGQPLARVLSIDVTGSTQITVAAMSSSSSSDRVLNIAAGHKDILVGEFPALGASLTMGTYSYTGGPTKLFFYSPSSGVNVYYIKTVRVANADATLSALSVNTGDLSPVFDPAVNSYTLAVPFGTSSVTVNATANDANATVTGTGDVDVSSGSGTANVVVTAEDGTTTATYTITITVLTSIEKANGSEMFVYPTVSAGIFNIDFAGKPGVITVYDLTGKLVLQRTASSSLEQIRIEKAGIYLIRMESENQFRTVRVVSVK